MQQFNFPLLADGQFGSGKIDDGLISLAREASHIMKTRRAKRVTSVKWNDSFSDGSGIMKSKAERLRAASSSNPALKETPMKN
jgi:hypothetical protein